MCSSDLAQQPGAAGASASLENMSDRLSVDPQGNALIFRGLEAEIAQVRSLLTVIDVPNSLKPKSFFAGANAASIAMFAHAKGYGEVTTIGDGYVLTLRLLTTDSAKVLASFQASGKGPQGLIEAADKVARDLRAKAGESLR